MEHTSDQQFVFVGAEDLKDYNSAGILPQPAHVVVSTQEWLGHTDYTSASSEYQRHLQAYVPGTCSIWEHDQFKHWQNSAEYGVLWIKAVPGSGKSVLAAATADRLSKEDRAPVLYFFFRETIVSNRTPHALFRDFLSQLLPYSPALQTKLKTYNDSQQECSSVSIAQLWSDLLAGIKSMGRKVYLVIDALDEMDSKHMHFLKLINDLADPPSMMKILLTSRPNQALQSVLRASCIRSVRMNPSSMLNDISVFVDHRLEASGRQGVNPDDLKQLKDTICSRANGLFLYARLMADKLSSALQSSRASELQFQTILERLPNDLEGVYEEILANNAAILEQGPQYQRYILNLIVHATRPLRLIELGAALKSNFHAWPENLEPKGVVRATCGSLIEILEDETVQIIHHSLTEFLLDQTRIQFRFSLPVDQQFTPLNSHQGHREILLCSIAYINQVLTAKKSMTDAIAEALPSDNDWLHHPFLRYAVSAWHTHAKHCDIDDAEIFALLDEFLVSDGVYFIDWIESMSRRSGARKEVSFPAPWIRLHAAASAGLARYAEYLLKARTGLNMKDAWQRTAIHFAVLEGHDAVVQLLIRYSANLNEPDLIGLKPIHLAAIENRPTIFGDLVAAGVDPMTPNTSEVINHNHEARGYYGTAVKYAFNLDHRDIVEQLMYRLETPDLEYGLWWAVAGGNTDLVKQILDHSKASPDSTLFGDTVLFVAASARHSECVQALVSRGANVHKLSEGNRDSFSQLYIPSMTSGLNMTPLHGFASGPAVRHTTARAGFPQSLDSSGSTLKILLEHGCGLESTDASGRTPLACIINTDSVFSPGFVALFLEAGANPCATNHEGKTLLHENGHDWSYPLVSLVLQYGGKVNLQDKKGLTPLHVAVLNRRNENIKQLLEHGADTNICDFEGQSPLFSACEDISRTAMLLAAGADVNQKDKRGQTCAYMLRNGLESVKHRVANLAQAGLNIESKDLEGCTALLRHVRNDNLAVINALLDAGANIETRDHKGRTCIHIVTNWLTAHTSTSYHTIKYLLENGANHLWTDNDGNNLLHSLARGFRAVSEQVYFLRNVLELGLDLHARNNYGRTFLHVASYRPIPEGAYVKGRDKSLIDILRENLDLDLNVTDNEGWTPMHLAAATSEAQVFLLYNAGARLDVFSNSGVSPLHVACRARQPNIVWELLKLCEEKHISMVEHTDDKGRTPLFDACQSGRTESVRALLDHGVNVHATDNSGRTPLHACANFDTEQALWTAIYESKGTRENTIHDEWRPIDTRYPDESEARIECDTAGVGEIAELLLSRGADPNCYVLSGSTPRDLAISSSCADLVKALIKRDDLTGISRNTPTNSDFVTELLSSKSYDSSSSPILAKSDLQLVLRQYEPSLMTNLFKQVDEENKIFILTWMVKWGCTNVLQGSKAGGDQPLITSEWLRTILQQRPNMANLIFEACQRKSNNVETIKILVETFGVDTNTRISCQDPVFQDLAPGSTVLHYLASGNYFWYLDAIEYLLQQGADIDARNSEGRTPLFEACNVYYRTFIHNFFKDQVVELLLRKGADPNVVDNDGLTCLNQSRDNAKVLKTLLDHGADISAGSEPVLGSAIRALEIESVQIFLEAGADCNKPLLRKGSGSTFSDGDEQYPLLAAAFRGYRTGNRNDTSLGDRPLAIKIMDLLLAHGAEWTIPLNDGRTILHHIVNRRGHIQPFLSRQDVDWNARDQDGVPVLLEACRTPGESPGPGRRRFIENPCPLPIALLLDHGVDYTITDHQGQGILHYLMKNTREDVAGVVSRLLAMNAPKLDVKRKDNSGFTALHVAMHAACTQTHPYRKPKVRLATCKELVSHGADITEADPDGVTSLHRLALLIPWQGKDDNEAADFFHHCLSRGVSIDSVNSTGQPPLFWYLGALLQIALPAGKEPEPPFPLLEMLFKDADFHIRDCQGQNALHVVAGAREDDSVWSLLSVELFKFLLAKGLDPLAEDRQHRTSLDIASTHGKRAIMKLFESDR